MASGLDDRLRVVFFQQGLRHFSCLVVPPQTLIDEFFILIFVCLDKDRFEDAHPLVNRLRGCVFSRLLVRWNRRHAHEDVPDKVLEVRENAALGQVDGVPELMVRFDKTVLVIHSGVPLKDRFSSLTPCPSVMASTEASLWREVDFRSRAAKAMLTDGLINGKRVSEYGPWVSSPQ